MYSEDELLPLSAVQHLAFCERQCALIYIERIWEENVLSIEGAHLHECVHETGRRTETRGDVRITRGLPLRSLKLGLSGVADVVEFHRLPPNLKDGRQLEGELPPGVPLQGASGLWQPFPVEYKRGTATDPLPSKIQLCAQALCLEEMLGVAVPEGALFLGVPQRRISVAFDTSLRRLTEETALRLHRLFASSITPRAVETPVCGSCSLVHTCRPRLGSEKRSAKNYLSRVIMTVLESSEEACLA